MFVDIIPSQQVPLMYDRGWLWLNGVPRVRAVGDRLVPLNDEYPHVVAFVLAPRTDEHGIWRPTPVGTAFFVSMPAALTGRSYIYVVTAAHAVRGEQETWIRVRTKAGALEAIPVPEWTYHPAADDVAVALVRGADRFDYIPLAEKHFLDAWDRRPTLGDRVYFIGLLSLVSAMVEDNVPMVRSGTLGRTFQERVPVKYPDGTIMRHTFHLIDSRSYHGFSGSPCMVQFEATRYQAEPTVPGGAFGNMGTIETLLLGLISSHLDDQVEIKRTGELANDELLGGLRAPVFTGVGLVTPVEKLRETLMDSDLQAQRERTDAELLRAEEEHKDEPTATPDTVPTPTEPFMKKDFDEALRRVARKVDRPKERQ